METADDHDTNKPTGKLHLFRLRAVDLIFLRKVTARETQARKRPRAAINDGVNPKRKK